MAQAVAGDYPSHDEELEKLVNFIENFTAVAEDGTMRPKYTDQLQLIANRSSQVFKIALDDLYEFDEQLGSSFQQNGKRYLSLVAKAADRCMPEPTEDIEHLLGDDPVECILRSLRDTRAAKEGEDVTVDELDVPADLKRRYEIHVEPSTLDKAGAIRDVQARHIGHVVTLKGLVTRVTDVRPMITVATYLTDAGGDNGGAKTIFQEVTGMSFMPLSEASGQLAASMNVKNGTPLTLQTRGSKLVKFQEVKVQEIAAQVPAGSIPRSVTIRVKGELTRYVKAGDIATFSGLYLPEPHQGYQALKAGLVARTFIEALHIRKEKETYAEQASKLSAEERSEIEELLASGDSVYSRLAKSIAPEIYGHEDVKKALLLLMVGGVTKQTEDGMRLRGDIHLCLMGDPGVAKSQMLKFLTNVAPRSVYTNGRGSSGVGLTAAVTQDPNTNEMILEGGALVLADMGICCIDEFDKMDETDRTSIHEVMEQQTVSIAKAGITTTLNARCSVLAAANPAYGRYDIRRSPQDNINLPASLLSRFDLLWLMIDKSDADLDRHLAEHVIHVHMNLKAPEANANAKLLTPKQLRTVIAMAREHEPVVPEDLVPEIESIYVELRRQEAQDARPSSYTTARSLMSVLRLSQGLARLAMRDEVNAFDVQEAVRLMAMSKASLVETDDEKARRVRHRDPKSEIYAVLQRLNAAAEEEARALGSPGTRRRKGNAERVVVEKDEIVRRLQRKFSPQEIATGLQFYEDLGVIAKADTGYWLVDVDEERPKNTL